MNLFGSAASVRSTCSRNPRGSRGSVDFISFFGVRSMLAHPGVELDEEDALEMGLSNLFRAYDLDDSGELGRDEFMKIEMRMSFEGGHVFRAGDESPFTLMDRDRSGNLDFLEFRERQLASYQSSGMSRGEILERLQSTIKAIILERVKMGARCHAGIRQALKCIFSLYDTSGDGVLSPEEWMAAQKVVALEIMDDIDERWVDEASFTAMDLNDNGRLELSEYLESSFTMFDGTKLHTEQLHKVLLRVRGSLETCKLDPNMTNETLPLSILVQKSEHPQFQPPHSAWQDEPTVGHELFRPTDFDWRVAIRDVRLPLHLQSAEEVASCLRLLLHLPSDTWLSMFFVDVDRRERAGSVTLLRGDRIGIGNVQSALERLTKPNAVHRVYVKNLRKKTHKLLRAPLAFFDERSELLEKQTGQVLGLQWHVLLVGEGHKLPQGTIDCENIDLVVGDTLLIEVPKTDDSGEFRFVSSIFMDGFEVMSRPVEKNILPHGHQRKRRSSARASVKSSVGADHEEQLMFVALEPGRCTLFIDVSWEDQEEKLAMMHKTCAPVQENSIARIGPLSIIVEEKVEEVQLQEIGKNMNQRLGKREVDSKGGILWWNGDKWGAKKASTRKRPKAKAKAEGAGQPSIETSLSIDTSFDISSSI